MEIIKNMKDIYYIHNTDNSVNLKEDAEIIKGNWGRRLDVKHPESVTYHEIYNREDYVKGDCRVMPGDVVVDCGGNIGIFASYALDMGASRVLSFEPFKDNFELNKKNNPNVNVFNLAVSNKSDDEIELLYTPSGNGGHSIVESELINRSEHYEHKNLYVKTITLDDIISRNFIDHIDYLKVDTEGAELMIFEGLSDENLDKIKNISIEYHHSVFKFDEKVYKDFTQRFISRGFNVFTWLLDNYTRMVYISKGDVFRKNPNHTS